MDATSCEEIDYLIYIDMPDWSQAHGDWRSFISDELRSLWPTFTYFQKWAIAQNAGTIAHMFYMARAQ